MATIMDIGGSDPLQANGTTSKFFSPETLSSYHHGCEASTSQSLHRNSNDIYDAGYSEEEMSPAPCIPTVCSAGTLEAVQEKENDRRPFCGFNDSSNSAGTVAERHVVYNRSRSAPGPTSCVFLEMALKRLYAKEDFDALESLGEGFFGDVYKVRHRITGEVMVLKVGKERERENRTRVKANVLKEVDVLNNLTSHPNLLAFRGVCVDSSENSWNLHILMDYCDAGSLSRLICDLQRCFPWNLRCSLARDISSAMKYVHSKEIMHRDLTSMNVLLQTVATSGSLKAVVADFGLSCKIPRASEKLIQVGTPYWMAPECLKEEFYDEKADVFSFGIILCQMIARIDADPEAGLYRTHNFGLDYVRFTAHCPTDTPLDFLNLAFRCCVMDPAVRPSFESVYDFFTKFPALRQNSLGESALLSVPSTDGRLGRSLSDATLRLSKTKESELLSCVSGTQNEQNTRIQSDCKSVNSVPLLVLQEGVSCEVQNCINRDEEMWKKSRMEELARSVAVDERSDEVSLDTGNPFMEHEIYKTTRKLAAFPETDIRRKRVVSEAKVSGHSNRRSPITFDTDLMDSSGFSNDFGERTDGRQTVIIGAKVNGHSKRILRNPARRSISLPNFFADFNNVSWTTDYTLFDPRLPSSSSAGVSAITAATAAVTVGTVQRVSKADIGEQCALKGQMSMAFKNEDQKFTSRRYPSRRYTVLNGTLFTDNGGGYDGGGSVEDHRKPDFSLSVDETILSRDINELTAFEYRKSDFTSMRQRNDIIMQQPFSVHLAADGAFEGTSGTQTALLSRGNANIGGDGGGGGLSSGAKKSVSEKHHRQVKRDTVVLAVEKKSTTAVADSSVLLDSFCVRGGGGGATGVRGSPGRRKRSSCCSKYRQRRIAQTDNGDNNDDSNNDGTQRHVLSSPPADYCSVL